ncbi:MAG: hypothetical protein AAB675_04415 [Patescibacteria group bacterium]
MTTKKIRKLAEITYVDREINRNILKKASLKLTKKELKIYIKSLKNIQKKIFLKVYVPSKKIFTIEFRKSLEKFFENKELEVIEDPSLMAGLRIVDNDMIYELNLKDSMENMVDYLQKTYD